jgi:DNA-binding transcriptional LysR family regulator
MGLGAVPDLRRLASFVAVAEEQHFGRAAARLFISQPALSQQIKALEAELGVELFVRLPSGIRLTAEGEALLPEARHLLQHAERFLTSAGATARSTKGHVRLGFVDHARAAVIPALLDCAAVVAPGVEFTLQSFATSRLALDDLNRGGSDAIVGNCEQTPDIETVALATERHVAAVPAGHPLAQEAEVSLAQLASEPFAMFPRALNPAGWESFMARFDQTGQRPTVVHEGRHIHDTILFVATGRGVALIPAPLAATLTEPTIAIRPIIGPAPENQIVLAWKKSNPNPSIPLLITVAAQTKQELSPTSSSAAPDRAQLAQDPEGSG